MQFPKPLKRGDQIAILSPASIINPEYVDGACQTLTDAGYRVRVMPHALESDGSYAGTHSQRLADLAEALTDSEVRAVLCSRGGYGSVHLLVALNGLDLKSDPKWLIGFSDISALHALMYSKGIVSIHASMAKALSNHSAVYPPNAMLLDLLSGRRIGVSFDSHPYNRLGAASGTLVGGNLAVLQALTATPFDLFKPGAILFIEDVGEPIYKVERMLCQLRLAGVLQRLSGLVVGQFTEYKADKNHAEMYDMIDEALSGIHIPVAFDAPIGHVDTNMPLLHGAMARIEIDSAGATLTYKQ